MKFRTRARHRVALATALAAVVAVTTGCSQTGPADPDAPISLTFASHEFASSDVLWDLFADYTGPNDNVTLVKETAPFAQYQDKLATQLGAGGGPDVFVVQDAYFRSFAEAGLLEPLDDVFGELENTNGTSELARLDGVQYAINWQQPVYAMLYNKQILADAGVEVPTTYEELLDAATTITETTGKIGFAGRSSVAELDGWSLEMSNWVFGFGGDLSDGENPTLDSPENIEAVEAFAELRASGAWSAGDDASTYRGKFLQGEVGILFDNSGSMPPVTIAEQADPAVVPNIGSAEIPLPAGQVIVNPTWIVVNANSEHVDAAKEFLRHALSPESQEQMSYIDGPAVSYATDFELPAEVLASIPWSDGFLASVEGSRTSVIEGFEGDSKLLWREFLTAVEAVIVGGESAESALAAAQQRVESTVG